MRTHLLLTRKRKLDRCDQCGTKEPTAGIAEYLLPYGRGHKTGRYRDLCRACQKAIEDHPDQWVTIDTDLSKSAFRRRLREVL